MADEILDIYKEELKKCTPLDKDAEYALLCKAKNENDVDARNKVIQSNLRYALKIALSYCNQGVDANELVEEATMGLIKAYDEYDLTKQVKFYTYAVWWIRQRIQIYLSKNNRLGDKETISTDAEFDNILDDASDSDYDGCLHDRKFSMCICDDEDDETNEEIVKMNKALSNLQDIERTVVEMYYGLGYGKEFTLQEISGECGVSSERVRQIKKNAIRKLRHFVV